MAALPRAYIDEYTRQINKLSEASRASLAEALSSIDISDPASFDTVVALMQDFCSVSDQAAAQIAAAFYDFSREYCIGEALGAMPLSNRVPEATTVAVKGVYAQHDTVEGIVTGLQDRVDYEIKRGAAQSSILNGQNDPRKPRFARVPSGGETCTFCLMLASRGFVYRSAQKAGELGHYHAHCDCRIVVGWDDTEIEGYDPAALYDKWQAALEDEAKAKAERSGLPVATERHDINATLKNAGKNL